MDFLLRPLAALNVDPFGAGFLFAAVIGLTAALAAWSVMQGSLSLTDPLRRRLRAVRGEVPPAAPDAAAGRMARWLEVARPFLEPRRELRRTGLQLKLTQAGFDHARALTVMYAAKVLAALLLPAGLLAALLFGAAERPDAAALLLLGAIAALLGWFAPDAAIAHRREKRQRLLLEALPDALDLLVACTQAGLGLNAAIQRVAEQLPHSHPGLAYELQLVNAEIRAGVDRNVALRNLAERTGLEDIRGLAGLMSQSLRFGTGVAETLKIFSEEFRDRRMQRAEELAGEVGTRLIFPLCLCIFPAFFVVAVGPAVIGVIRVFGQ